jgi:hypothetical protein
VANAAPMPLEAPVIKTFIMQSSSKETSIRQQYRHKKTRDHRHGNNGF